MGRVAMLGIPFLLIAASLANGQGNSRLDDNLRSAARYGDTEKVRELLAAGADPNGSNQHGHTPLRSAASDGHLEVIELLIDAGADVNFQHPKQHRSILAIAASRSFPKGQNTEVVKLLLSKGAGADPQALQAACWGGQAEVAALLVGAGISPDAGLPSAAQGGHIEIITFLLRKGADVNGADGRSPLKLAALQGGVAAVKTLLDAGADPNAADEKGDTPLHVAVTGRGNLQVARLLVETGARIDTANNTGITPIRKASIAGAVEIYDWLLMKSGGKEPQAANIEEDRTVRTSDLLIQLLSQSQNQRVVAQRQLVGRGESIMPEVLAKIEAGEQVLAFAELFTAMGPRANAAIPRLDVELDDEEQVFGALVTLIRMNPRNVQRLPSASKKRAADSLVKGIHKHKRDMYGPFLMGMLVGIGEDATPQCLGFLEGDNPELRAGVARKLSYAAYDSEAIEESLIDILLNDPVMGVREFAARGLMNPHFHSEEAKRALIEVLATPRIQIENSAFRDGSQEAREKQQREQRVQREYLNEAASALASYGPSVIAELRDRLAAADDATRENYMGVYDLLGNNPETVPAFAQLLDDPSKIVRESAHRQMARLAAQHSDKSGDLLLERYSEGDEQVRGDAANAIAGIPAGSNAPRFLPSLLAILADSELNRRTRMRALGAALRVDTAATQQAEQVAEFLELLVDEAKHGEYASRIHALGLIENLGAAARPVVGEVEALSQEPLPPRPADLPKAFRPGIDDQPGSPYRQYARERGTAESVRRCAVAALDAIRTDSK